MATLDRWRAFLDTPRTLVFPKLELIGRDHEPPLCIGTGEVRMASPDEFTFKLKGILNDPGYTLREIRAQHDAPYDALARFRLHGVDTDGVAWSGGYTVPVVDAKGADWMFTGELESLSTDDQSAAVTSEPCTELIFLVPGGHLMALAMVRFAHNSQQRKEFERTHTLEILGSTVRFAYAPAARTLSVTATQSPGLTAPYPENWLAEPLRIMFGQLVYPRLVARNLGDGRAFVWVRRSPKLIRSARWAALLGLDELDKAAFWACYARLLRLVALARNADGGPKFEAHKLTHLYEEIVQASLGSRWVWALTFAASIEALVKMLIPVVEPSEDDADGITSLVRHINNWTGESRLKQAAANAVRRTAELTTFRAMRTLEVEGVISGSQLSTWQAMRNAVMHGSLTSRYSEQEEDQRLLTLATMMHALTRELIRRSGQEQAEAFGGHRA